MDDSLAAFFMNFDSTFQPRYTGKYIPNIGQGNTEFVIQCMTLEIGWLLAATTRVKITELRVAVPIKPTHRHSVNLNLLHLP